ncbi:MAG: alpha/beta fold hydrolase [Deltaproteobacteria bacterium]|nr:alpha/beta fold hydrolase [Deltaproteobacteria bacterium]
MNRLPAPPMPPWLLAHVPFKRYLIDVDGHRFHVMENGRGSPVLMLHGNPSWGFLYRKVATALASERLRVIMPDLLGLGFSDKPPDPCVHSLENHARWIGGLIDQLGLDQFVFVGQDWGGPIGFRALADRKDRVAGLVILNTVVGPPRRDFRPTAFHRFAHVPIVSDVVFRRLGFPQNTMALAQGNKLSIRGEVARAYRFPLMGLDNNAAPLALARMVPSDHAHPSIEPLRRSQEFVEEFPGPTAIVWGDRDPVLGGVIRWLEKLLPRAEITHTSAGHFLQEEVPDAIAAAVRRVASRSRAS